MAKPIAVQLYSLRQYAEKDFVGVLKRVAEIGYKAVEPAGFWDLSPAEFKKITDDLGLQICSTHIGGPRDPEQVDQNAEILKTLGVDLVCTGCGGGDFKDIDSMKRAADVTNEIVEKYKKYGITVFQHNHYWEFARLDDQIKYDLYMQYCPDVKIELDAFWATNNFVEDPVAITEKYADRIVLLHMKDGNKVPRKGEESLSYDLRALGTGMMPIADVIGKTADCCRNVIVELDFCNIEMWDAIEQSYHYLVDNGLAEGNK